jgi:hypothetical protein
VSDATLRSTEGLILTLLVVSFGLWLTLACLGRRRPGFNVTRPLAVAFTLRMIAVAGINASGLNLQLRGGDEITFLDFAHYLAGTPWGRGLLPHAQFQLQTDVFAVQIKLFNLSATSIRVTQIWLSLTGILLLVAAVYDLASPRAARWCMWILAVEPANIFFSSEIHKEALMFLASGLVVLGGTKVWQRLDPVGVVMCVLAGVIAVETRAYAGWFLVAAGVLVLLHAGLRKLERRPLVAMPVIYGVIVAAALVAPTLLAVTSNANLQKLQAAQGYTTGGQVTQNTGGSGQDNLALEQVDFSTRGAVLENLPQRMLELIDRPYPWQLADPSQELGAVGTLLAVGGAILLIRLTWRRRRRFLSETAPILYPLLFLWIAYALSAGNAGTGFRYRTHVVMLGAALLSVLYDRQASDRAGTRSEPARRNPATPPSAASALPV